MTTNQKATRHLVLKAIPKGISDEEVRELLSDYGNVTNCNFHSKQEMNIKMAFISYETVDEAVHAQQNLFHYKFKYHNQLLDCHFNSKYEQRLSSYAKVARKFVNRIETNTSDFRDESKDRETIRALVTHVENAKYFWAQAVPDVDAKKAQQMTAAINAYCESVVNGENGMEQDAQTTCYAAKFADGKWYRVEVKDKSEDPVHILFVDYGNTSSERLNNLIPLPERLCGPALCHKYCLEDAEFHFTNPASERKRVTLISNTIFDKYVILTFVHKHSTDPDCSVVSVEVPSVSGASLKLTEELDKYELTFSMTTAGRSDSSNQSANSISSASQTAQQPLYCSHANIPCDHTSYHSNMMLLMPKHLSTDCTALVSQGTQQPSPLAQLSSPLYQNQFTFPTTSTLLQTQQPQQQQPEQQQQQQQQQQQLHPPQLQQQEINSAFQTYQKYPVPSQLGNPLSPPVVSSSVHSEQLCHPSYDPLHGPGIIIRYRQELEDMDERIKATSGRVISLEAQNSELRRKIDQLESPVGCQQLFDRMTDKLVHFLSAKKEVYSGQDVPSPLSDIAKEVLSNRNRFSLSQMSEVVEFRAIQHQLADLITQIRSHSEGEESPSLSQLITQRNECRGKLIHSIDSLVETLCAFPLEERMEALNAIKERLVQIPSYNQDAKLDAKHLDLSVCLETFESVQSLDTSEMKLGLEGELGLDELCAKIQRFGGLYQRLWSLDPNLEIGEERGAGFSELVHAIIHTSDTEIAALEVMKDVHLERKETASSSLTEAVAYELKRELSEVNSIKSSLVPELLTELGFLQTCESNPPSLTELLATRKKIKKMRSDLRHLRVDLKEAVEDSDFETSSAIETNVYSLLGKFHHLLLREHEQLLCISELAASHFAELPILYPDLSLLRQIEFGPIYMPSWEEDYFGELKEVVFFPESTYLTTFNEEQCLLREFELVSPSHQLILAKNVTILCQIQCGSVLSCDAMFFNKSGTKAFLKQPTIEGKNVSEYFCAVQSCDLSKKHVLLQILKGLVSIHGSGLHCRRLTEMEIFVNGLDVLITNIELVTAPEGIDLYEMQKRDLFNFSTLTLSLFLCYERNFLDTRANIYSIVDLVRTSGLEQSTLDFVLNVLEESSTALSLVQHGYFNELSVTRNASPCDRECLESFDNFMLKEEVGGNDDEVELLMTQPLPL